MKIPHHLYLARSGRWHFRRRVPADLVDLIPQRYIKKTLGTSQLAVAQVRALAVNAQCLSIFAALRSKYMTTKSSKTRISADHLARFDYTLELKLPDGLVLKTTDADDHGRAMEALKEILPVLRQQVATNASIVSKPKSISVRAAASQWSLQLSATTKPKTASQKRLAINEFMVGREDTPLSDIGRTDVSEWVSKLRNSGINTPTITNKLSYLRGFFDWALGAGHYCGSDNPAKNQVKYGRREKALRKQNGWRPLTLHEIAVVFSPGQLARLVPEKRWVSILLLYTGARVSEIAQLSVDDVVVRDGHPCIDINDERPGQSIKNESSRRVVPLHPDVLALGFMDYVEGARESAARSLFRASTSNVMNGKGNSFSTAFGRHVRACLPPRQEKDPRKVGCHSLRKSAIQKMQDGQVPKEHRMQYTGHEAGDVHGQDYSRPYTMPELAAAVHPALRFELDIEGLTAVMQKGPLRRRATG